MLAKLVIYASLVIALAILISSTARMGDAVLFPASTGGEGNTSGDLDKEDDDSFHQNENERPILPINQRKSSVKNGETDSVSDVLPRLLELPRRTIDPSKLPYKCGVILVQHHNTGGTAATIEETIRALIHTNDDSGATYISSLETGTKDTFIARINQLIQMKGDFFWTFLHSHQHGLALASDEDMLRRLRENVEERECHLVAMSIFLDPLDYSMKQTFQEFSHCTGNCNVNELTLQLEETSDLFWRGQLDYFLYNTGEILPTDTKIKVKDAINKLRQHYDLVLLESKGDDFTKEILKITGWESPGDDEVEVISMEVGDVRYSKQMVKQYAKFDAKNGDADFYDALNHVYHNDLAYLFNQ